MPRRFFCVKKTDTADAVSGAALILNPLEVLLQLCF